MPIAQAPPQRKPRLAFVAYTIAPNDSRYLKLRRSFERAGYETMSFAPMREGIQNHLDVACIRSTISCPRGGVPAKVSAALNARAMVHSVSRAISQFHPDVIYVFDPEALPIAVAAKIKTKARLVYDAHEFHEEEDPSHPERGVWVKRAETRAAPFLDAFVTVNASIAAEYEKRRRGVPTPLVVHNAVEAAKIGTDDGRLRRAAGVPDYAKVVLYHGNFSRMRGLEKLVAAAALFPQEWRLVLLGSGPLQQELMTLAAHDRVTFLPPVSHDDLADWIAGADIGAVLYEDLGSSQHFCSPNKLWEYPASGVPVIASDLPEIRKVVSRGPTGELVPPQCTPSDIAKEIVGLSSATLSQLAQNARRFHSSMNWENEVAPLLKVLDALLL